MCVGGGGVGRTMDLVAGRSVGRGLRKSRSEVEEQLRPWGHETARDGDAGHNFLLSGWHQAADLSNGAPQGGRGARIADRRGDVDHTAVDALEG